jgi:hypothetical protein
MESEESLPSSHEHTSGLYPEPDESNSHPFSVRCILTSSYALSPKLSDPFWFFSCYTPRPSHAPWVDIAHPNKRQAAPTSLQTVVWQLLLTLPSLIHRPLDLIAVIFLLCVQFLRLICTICPTASLCNLQTLLFLSAVRLRPRFLSDGLILSFVILSLSHGSFYHETSKICHMCIWNLIRFLFMMLFQRKNLPGPR